MNGPILEFSWQEVVQALLKAKGISEGHWQPGVRLQFGAFTAGADQNSLLPTGFVGVERITLRPATGGDPFTFSAVEAPAPPARAPRKRRIRARLTP